MSGGAGAIFGHSCADFYGFGKPKLNKMLPDDAVQEAGDVLSAIFGSEAGVWWSNFYDNIKLFW